MNTHSINDDESDIDALESLTTSHASSISSINSSVTTINNKLSGSTSSGLKTLTTTNLDGINGILNHTTTSNLKSFVDANTNKTGITPSQASIITQNSNKLNMAVASTMKNAVDANTNRYPQFTNFKRYHNQGGDIYNDGKIKLAWNATSRQLQFYVLDIPSGEYMVGGVQKWTTTSSTRVANYISQSNSSYYHYFTGPQLSGAVLNSSFNLSAHYTRATYFLHPYNEFAYPSYEITILVGYSQGYHQFSIKKFSN